MKSPNVAKAIYLEWRKAETKLEKECYGVTTTDNTLARIFFNIKAKGQQLPNTFFHEMTHVFFAFHSSNVPKEEQEKLAQKIGAICAEVLK